MPTRRDLLSAAVAAPFAAAALTARASRTAQPKWLADIATQLQAEFGLPAVWLAADIEDSVHAAVAGVKKYGDPTPASLDDLLTVASVSKPMAGIWIATLVQQGRIGYDAKVLDLLPELAQDCLSEHRSITLEQCLLHTAAVLRDVDHIPNDLPLSGYVTERLRQARVVLSSPSPPGTVGKEVYSNNGVTLAVTMAERAAGEPYESSAGRLFRDQLALPSWGVWAMDLPDDLSTPWPHEMHGRTPVPHPPRSNQFQFVRPSGSAHCTIADLVRFGLSATNATTRPRPNLSAALWEEIAAPQPDNTTLLTSFHEYGPERAFLTHNGSLGTTATILTVFPQWRIALAAHTNASGDAFRDRAMSLLQDAVRRMRVKSHTPPQCRISLTGVAPVDAAWQAVVEPRSSDDKLRIRVNFHIEAEPRTGDLQTLVRIGSAERIDNRFHGLVAGNHQLNFEFDTPATKSVPVYVRVDSLGTGGNVAPDAATYEAVLTIA